MAVYLAPIAGVAAQFFDNNGNPLSGGKLYTYQAGTTTPAVTYTTNAGVNLHTNPIVLDSGGRIPNGGEVWLSDNISYKLILKTSDDVTVATWDNIDGINSNFLTYTLQQEIQTATEGQTVFNLSTITYQPATNTLSVYVDGLNQYGPDAAYSYVETDSNTVTFNDGLHEGALVKFTTAVNNTGNAVDASAVTYTALYAGSEATNVQIKLSETVSVKDFGAIGDGSADDTVAIQAAVDTGKLVYFPNGTYKITNTINITSPYQKFIGESRTSVDIVNTNNSVYAIQYLSPIQAAPYDIDTGLVFDSLTITSKYGIKLNQSGDFATVFNLQGHIKNIRFIDCSFIGTYSASVDPNFNTAVAPTEAELEGYGVGLRCAKLFDSLIQNCYFAGLGIGVYFDGCDINNIDTNRFVVNARHIHLKVNTTYGYQTKIQNNDMLANARLSGIYDTCAFTSVKDNYFETYTASAQHYKLDNGYGNLFTQNRIDSSGQVTPILSLAPKYGMIVSNNRLNPSGTSNTIEILDTNYTSGVAGVQNNFLIKFSGNSGTFPVPLYPFCEYDFNNPRLFNYINPKVLGGTPSIVWPFKLSTISGMTDQWVLKTDVSSLTVYFDTQPQDFSFKVNAIGTALKSTVATSVVTISNASPAVVTWNAHGLINGNKIVFSTTGSLPSPLVAGTIYYVAFATTNTFEVSATSGGASINTTSAGSGVQTCSYVPGGFATVRWGGINVFSGFFGFSSLTKPELATITITKPAAVLPDSGLEFELVNTEVEYQAIELISI